MTIKRFLSFIVLLSVSVHMLIAQEAPTYKGKPWTRNLSRPYRFATGLDNVHMSVWASHGFYYDGQKERWKFQRPQMFCTTEDLFTQTIVLPYLIPMLENSGAVVFSPRERGWQPYEIIVDNDNISLSGYKESGKWYSTGNKGFANLKTSYFDGENPFLYGTARMTEASPDGNRFINYMPSFPVEDEYPVYVSYQTLPGSVDDAEYIVYHQGEKTVINVNQKMGGSTWTYIGTYRFDKGQNQYNMVTLSNKSDNDGIVTADAVRFGAGMGNIVRGGTVSGLPRCLEGARYYAQWAGAPYSVYGGREGTNDYADDINSRSLFTNYLAGGSPFVKNTVGLGVPIELVLAVHSDAGFSRDCSSLIGSLGICTTNTDGGVFPTGVSRQNSFMYGKEMLSGLQRDLGYHFGKWHTRGMNDKNYSETRLPKMPSMILETLSHQNFSDIKLGADPNFRFVMARSIYKTMARFVADMHDRKITIQPLAPDNFRMKIKGKNRLVLSWDEVDDPLEKSADPSAYILYTAVGTGGFDNGRLVKGRSIRLKLEQGVLYSFKVTAVNKGGESFPTEVLSARINGKKKDNILIVNGFHRLSSPAFINNNEYKGFDLNNDMGMWRGKNPGFCGAQIDFSTKGEGLEGPGGLGYSGNELVGKFLMGNEFNYVRCHADAIAAAGDYNIISCSSHAIDEGLIDLDKFKCIDLILGEEKDDGRSLVRYKTFSPFMRESIGMYVSGGGNLLVSGSHVTSDLRGLDEKTFGRAFLNTEYAGKMKNSGTEISAFGRTFTIYDTVNEKHYAAPYTDVLRALNGAKPLMKYSSGHCAATLYDSNEWRSIVMGFPFECIRDTQSRRALMKDMINYLVR